MDEVTIYTDGACSGNPGPGGWGAILMYQGIQKEISGGKKDTTNNVMELTAVIEALKLLNRPCKVDLYSDSAYVVNAFIQKWTINWQKNNWKTSDKKDVKNKELYKNRQQIIQDLQNETYDRVYIIGHSLGKADWTVFQAINRDAEIICTYHTEKDRNSIETFMIESGFHSWKTYLV